MTSVLVLQGHRKQHPQIGCLLIRSLTSVNYLLHWFLPFWSRSVAWKPSSRSKPSLPTISSPTSRRYSTQATL
ncbi:hypothetical protein RO3G_11964 [Rhizopus delemar RA 99-880]|uniref:Uncharacterized protein n=1 Tax=Rhizopus delemar (strain RA 99-880 / ATCC MYA-4621 / FGSC 9543 / NRRL 43880) TaxID=246409 RepID=I1CFM3_RHIO9|nr:hypothetical protein RO3G_11964 [Rhizopus delemar RA 99-880]|eukprot:EIE87253.1 hypothetical protein RO3G_11964 [Rhizopus delemar RA 99-880]